MNGLDVCGSGGTNAFVNLSRSAGLEARRLLLLAPEHTAKHVVAEVHLEGRWVIVDPAYHVLMKDSRGESLDPQRPAKSGNTPGSDQFAAQLPSRILL